MGFIDNIEGHVNAIHIFPKEALNNNSITHRAIYMLHKLERLGQTMCLFGGCSSHNIAVLFHYQQHLIVRIGQQ